VTTSLFLRRYWRVALVAVLGALIAFGGSFMNEPTYASSTRLLSAGGTPRSSPRPDRT